MIVVIKGICEVSSPVKVAAPWLFFLCEVVFHWRSMQSTAINPNKWTVDLYLGCLDHLELSGVWFMRVKKYPYHSKRGLFLFFLNYWGTFSKKEITSFVMTPWSNKIIGLEPVGQQLSTVKLSVTGISRGVLSIRLLFIYHSTYN